MAKETTVCSVCGVSNEATASRCTSCGAKLEALGPGTYDDDEGGTRGHHYEGFQWKWVLVALTSFAALHGVLLVILPFVISAYDPQGLAGLLIAIALWFVGGVITGIRASHRVFVEPTVAALLTVIPILGYLLYITPEGFEPSMMAYVAGGLLGVMMAPFGSVLGDYFKQRARSTASA